MRISDWSSDVCSSDLGCRRHGEDDVEVFDRQQFGLTGGEPLDAGLALALRAVPVAAGVVGVTDAAALPAVLDMAAECRRAAQLDGAHPPPLDPAQVTVMRTAIGIAVPAEHVRDR